MTSENRYSKNLYLLGLSTILLIILGDLLRRFALFTNLAFDRYTAIAKIGILLTYILFIFYYRKHYLNCRNKIKIALLTLMLLIIFLFSNIIIEHKYFNIANFEFLIRYLFFPITFLTFYDLVKYPDKVYNLFKAIEILFLINCFLILLGYIFDIEIFKTYPNPNRFGFSGIFNRANQVSYITILFMFIYVYKLLILKINKAKFFFALLASLLVGTKKILFSIIIILVYFLYITRKKYIKSKIIVITVLSLSILLFRNNLKLFFISNFSIFMDIYKEHGFITMIMSFRDKNLREAAQVHIIERWEFLNILVGGSDFTLIRSELAFIDLFLFFGLIGILIYLVLAKLFYDLIDNNSKTLLLLLSLIIFTASMSGGFFSSVNIPFIFIVILFYFKSIPQKSTIS